MTCGFGLNVVVEFELRQRPLTWHFVALSAGMNVLMAALVLVLLVTACGGDIDASGSGERTDTVTSATPVPASPLPTEAASDPIATAVSTPPTPGTATPTPAPQTAAPTPTLGESGGIQTLGDLAEALQEAGLGCDDLAEGEPDVTAVASGQCTVGGEQTGVHLFASAVQADATAELAGQFGGFLAHGDTWGVAVRDRAVAAEIAESLGGRVGP